MVAAIESVRRPSRQRRRRLAALVMAAAVISAGCAAVLAYFVWPHRVPQSELRGELSNIEQGTGLSLPPGTIVVEHAVTHASIDPASYWTVEVSGDGVEPVRSALARIRASSTTIMGDGKGAPAWWKPCVGQGSAVKVFEFGGAVIRVYVCEEDSRVRLFIQRITF